MGCVRMLCLCLSFTAACVEAEDLELRSAPHLPPLVPGLHPLDPPRLLPPEPYELPCSDVETPPGPIDPLGEWCRCMSMPGTGPSGPMVHYCIDMLTGEITPDVTMYMYCEEHYGDLVDLVELFRESCSPLFGGNEG